MKMIRSVWKSMRISKRRQQVHRTIMRTNMQTMTINLRKVQDLKLAPKALSQIPDLVNLTMTSRIEAMQHRTKTWGTMKMT